MSSLALCTQLERMGCGLHRGTSQPESPRARKLWGQGGMTGSLLRCKTLFPPFLYCVSSWSLFSNSLGNGFLEDQSTCIWSVSIRAIFSKTSPCVLATWVSRQGKGEELPPEIKTQDIKKIPLEWILRKLFVERYTSHCNWNTASSCVWASNMGLVTSLMSSCEVGLVGLSSALHTVQHHWQPGQSKGQETKGTNPSPTERPCRSHLRENGRADASPVSQGQMQTGSPAFLNNFCWHHTSTIKMIHTEICLSLIPVVCPGDWNYFRDIIFFTCPSISQQRWGCKFLDHCTKKKKNRIRPSAGTDGLVPSLWWGPIHPTAGKSLIWLRHIWHLHK